MEEVGVGSTSTPRLPPSAPTESCLCPSPGPTLANPNNAEDAEFPVAEFPIGTDARCSGWTLEVPVIVDDEDVAGVVDAMELTLSRSLEAFVPIQLPHDEIAAEARAAATSVLEDAVAFVAVVFVDDTEATDAKLNGRSFFSPLVAVPVDERIAGENDDGGCDCVGGGFGEGPSEIDGRWETILFTPPRTPSKALKRLVEPAEKTFVMVSRAGASCWSR